MDSGRTGTGLFSCPQALGGSAKTRLRVRGLLIGGDMLTAKDVARMGLGKPRPLTPKEQAQLDAEKRVNAAPRQSQYQDVDDEDES